MKILVVEDDLDVLRVLNKRLTAEGYHVLTASQGEEAVKIAKIQHPDLALVDIILPDIDGSEVVKRLRAYPLFASPIPVLFLSGIVKAQDSSQKMEVIVDGRTFPAIAKPFVFEELLRCIKLMTRSVPPNTDIQ